MTTLQLPCLFFLHPFAKPFVDVPNVEWTSALPLLAAVAVVIAFSLAYRRHALKKKERLDAERGVSEWINDLSSSQDIRLFVSDGSLFVQGVANLGPQGSPERFYRPDLYAWPPGSFDFIYYEDSFWHHYAETPEALEALLWEKLAPGGVFVHAFRGKVAAILRKPRPPGQS